MECGDRGTGGIAKEIFMSGNATDFFFDKDWPSSLFLKNAIDGFEMGSNWIIKFSIMETWHC